MERYKGIDFGTAVKRLADEVCKAPPEKQRDVFKNLCNELWAHYGKCKTTNVDEVMVKKALEERGL